LFEGLSIDHKHDLAIDLDLDLDLDRIFEISPHAPRI